MADGRQAAIKVVENRKSYHGAIIMLVPKKKVSKTFETDAAEKSQIAGKKNCKMDFFATLKILFEKNFFFSVLLGHSNSVMCKASD